MQNESLSQIEVAGGSLLVSLLASPNVNFVASGTGESQGHVPHCPSIIVKRSGVSHYVRFDFRNPCYGPVLYFLTSLSWRSLLKFQFSGIDSFLKSTLS